jgi:predicted permease
MGIFEDLRHGFRVLAKSRTLTIAAVLSLALGVGANSTVFTLLNAVLLRPLPVEDPTHLVAVQTLDSHNPGLWQNSFPNFQDYRDRNHVFSSMFLYTAVTLNLTGRGDPRLLIGQLVSWNYFSVLGVRPALGRGFLPADDAAPGASPVVVLSYRMWDREFARDPAVTSRTLALNGRKFQIIGVAPRGFQGLNELYGTDLWMPSMMYPGVYPNANLVNERRALLFNVIGRLKPGVQLGQAEAGLQVVARDLEREYPGDNAGRRIRLVPLSETALAGSTRDTAKRAGLILMIISGMVLLIACANVASLLLVRAAGRGREIAVRLALGSSRWQLVRQLVIESLLLSLVGGAAGLALAAWARDALWSMRPSQFEHAGIRPDVDLRVLGYGFAVALITGVIFGLVPALRATHPDLGTELKERSGEAAPTGGVRVRSLLVAGQVAFSVVALVGAGLFIRSMQNALHADLGFDADHLATVAFDVADQSYTKERGREYQRRVLQTALRTPGVLSASLGRDLPLTVSLARTVTLDGSQTDVPGKGRITLTSFVSPGYFRTLRIPLLRGRDFSPLDTETAPRVAIVNEVAAANFWPGQDPIGKYLHFYGDPRPAEVVGVARNACYRAVGERPSPLLYLSYDQYYFSMGGVYLRTAGDPAAVVAAVRRAMQPIEPNLLLEIETFGQRVRESLWAQRLSAVLLAIFGGLALLLATVGIYGVLSYSVSRRAREIGVRMAMGATAADVRLMILREGVGLALAGVAAGVAIALVASRWVTGLLFGTDPRDLLTFASVAAILTTVAVLACWVPARRATRIDPASALRDE